MAVSPFHRLSHAHCRVSLKRKVLAQRHVITRRRKNLASAKPAAPRTRGSVRRASGFVQILITLIIRVKTCKRLKQLIKTTDSSVRMSLRSTSSNAIGRTRPRDGPGTHLSGAENPAARRPIDQTLRRFLQRLQNHKNVAFPLVLFEYSQRPFEQRFVFSPGEEHINILMHFVGMRSRGE